MPPRDEDEDEMVSNRFEPTLSQTNEHSVRVCHMESRLFPTTNGFGAQRGLLCVCVCGRGDIRYCNHWVKSLLRHLPNG